MLTAINVVVLPSSWLSFVTSVVKAANVSNLLKLLIFVGHKKETDIQWSLYPCCACAHTGY